MKKKRNRECGERKS